MKVCEQEGRGRRESVPRVWTAHQCPKSDSIFISTAVPWAPVLANMSLRNVYDHEVMSFQIQSHLIVIVGSPSPYLRAVELWGVPTLAHSMGASGCTELMCSQSLTS